MNNIINIQYRNATYFGTLKDHQRCGYGLVVEDNSTVIFGRWKQNQLDGPYIYLTDHLFSFGQHRDGKLNGFNVIISNNTNRQIFGMFQNGKIYGNSIIIQDNSIMVGNYINGQLQHATQKEIFRHQHLQVLLMNEYPTYLHTIQDYLTFLINEAAKKTNNAVQYNHYQPVNNVLKNGNKIFGYFEDQQYFGHGDYVSKIYGVMIGANKVLSVGYHKEQGQLEGLGRLYNSDSIGDGVFIDGQLKGIGIVYNIKGNKYSLGQHDGCSILEKGFGFPHRQIYQIRKQFHLRSINFQNDIFMIGLKAILKRAIDTTFNFPYKMAMPKSPKQSYSYLEKQNHLSSSKQSDKSPLRQRMSRYELQQQRMIQHSPQFQDININSNHHQRLTKYFKTQETQEYQSNKQFQAIKSKNQHSNLNNHKKLKSNSHLYQQHQPNKRKLKYNNKPISNKQFKNTKQLIKKLEQQQNTKRLDLDKIYRQSHIYRKKI